MPARLSVLISGSPAGLTGSTLASQTGFREAEISSAVLEDVLTMVVKVLLLLLAKTPYAPVGLETNSVHEVPVH